MIKFTAIKNTLVPLHDNMLDSFLVALLSIRTHLNIVNVKIKKT